MVRHNKEMTTTRSIFIILDRQTAKEVCSNRIKNGFHDHKREGVGVSVVGGRTRTRRTHKERKKDTVRHGKETDRYSKTDATGDHNYLFCGEDRSQ